MLNGGRVASVTVAVLLVCFCLCADATLTKRWGSKGHYIVASVGQKLLTQGASTALVNLLPEDNGLMDKVSSWADTVKYTKEYEWSSILHYINTPDWQCDYSHQRDCGNERCVSGAITNYTSRLTDPSISADEQAIAAKFVVHFVGDIHQPLHVGFTTDEGGNKFSGQFLGTSCNLHMLWDEEVVEQRISDNGGESAYITYLVNQLQSGDFHANVTQWLSCSASALALSVRDSSAVCPDVWAAESVGLACQYAYVDAQGNKIANGFDLGQDYYDFIKTVVDVQLAKGGLRLAAVFNSLLGQ